MLTCMSPTTCMSTLLHMSTYSLTMLTCSIKYVNMLKQVCQHAFHSQHACQEFSTCQHTAPFPDAGDRFRGGSACKTPAAPSARGLRISRRGNTLVPNISQNTETWIFAHKNKTLIRKSSQSTMLSTTPTKMFCVISIENGKLIAVGRS